MFGLKIEALNKEKSFVGRLKGTLGKVMAAMGLWIGSTLSGMEVASAGDLAGATDPEKKAPSFVGGVVLAVHHTPGSRNMSLVIRETRMDKKGAPICNAPTGRVLTVESVGGIFLSDKARLKSSMIVMESPGDITPRNIVPGECVTVAPDDIDRASNMIRSSITIEDDSLMAKKTDEFQKGLVELWARTSPAKGAVPFNWKGSKPRSQNRRGHSLLPAFRSAHPGQPA